MKTVFRVWYDEYGKIISDGGVMLIFLAAILAYPVFVSMPYFHEVLKDVPIAVVDLDHSQTSRQLSRMRDAAELLYVQTKPPSLIEAQQELLDSTVYAIIVIPDDFQKKILRKEQAIVAAHCDASYFLIYRQVKTGIATVCRSLSAGIEIRRLTATGISVEAALRERDPLPLLSIPLFNPAGGYASYVMPAVVIMLLQQTLLIGIGMIGGTVREKNTKAGGEPTTEHVGIMASIIGKTGAYFSLYALHTVYFVIIFNRLCRFSQRGSPADLILFGTPFLLAVIFLGLTLTAFFRTRETSLLILVSVSIPALFLVGFSWPAEAFPPWLRFLSFLLPSTAGVDGFLRINQMGAPLRAVFHDWFILWGLSAAYFCSAVIAMKHINHHHTEASPHRND